MTPPANNHKFRVHFSVRLSSVVAILLILFVGLRLQTGCLAQVTRTTGKEASPNSAAMRPVYKMVIRIVRPVWSADAMRSSAPPRFLPGNLFHFTDPNSDTQFLQKVRLENPGFVFDMVHAKRALTLPVDSEWQIPNDLTFQKLTIGLFAHNKELLLNHLDSSNSRTLSGGKLSKVDNHHSSYKTELTESQMDTIRRAGKIMLCYRIQQYFPDSQEMKQYMQSDLIQFMQPGETACLGTVVAVLDVPVDPNPFVVGKSRLTKPVLVPTDMIFVTVTK